MMLPKFQLNRLTIEINWNELNFCLEAKNVSGGGGGGGGGTVCSCTLQL